MNGTLLETVRLEKRFGKVHALNGVSIAVRRGEVVGLIGENGAGKSTLIRAISGVAQPDAGQIYWKGQPVRIDSVIAARRLGIETVHEGGLTIGVLSVSDNIFLTREVKKSVGPFRIIDKKKQREITYQLTSQLGLSINSPDQEVRFCSGGERQGTAIARALQFNAELLILDEPDVGVAPSGRRKIVELVKTVKARNLACILATPDVYRAQEVADRFYIMVRGTITAEIANSEGLDLEKIEEYLKGRTVPVDSGFRDLTHSERLGS